MLYNCQYMLAGRIKAAVSRSPSCSELDTAIIAGLSKHKPASEGLQYGIGERVGLYERGDYLIRALSHRFIGTRYLRDPLMKPTYSRPQSFGFVLGNDAGCLHSQGKRISLFILAI